MPSQSTYENGKGCFGWVILLILLSVIGCMSCTKVTDYSYLNTDRTQRMFRVSKWHELNWKFRDSTIQEVAYNSALLKYRDTTIFPITCPISGIEVRYYK